MRDTTRAHERVEEQQVPGVRSTFSLGTLMLPEHKQPTMLIIHFHSSPWLVELCAQRKFPTAAVMAVNLGAGSEAYRQPFLEPGEFAKIVGEAEAAVGGRKFKTIVLSSFSAGYGAVREILRDKTNWPRITSVILADSLYSEYGHEADDLGPFLAYLQSGKRLVITHSELYPGTYESTSEAVDWLLSKMGAKRKAVLRWGPIGMQQLSEASKGGFVVLGFAGNTADDHVDHLYGFERWYGLALPPPPAQKGPPRRPIRKPAVSPEPVTK